MVHTKDKGFMICPIGQILTFHRNTENRCFCSIAIYRFVWTTHSRTKAMLSILANPLSLSCAIEEGITVFSPRYGILRGGFIRW